MTGPVGVRFPRAAKRSILVIGASTGGPQALTRILRGLPAGLPVPVALVLHLPVGYTQPFAERLDRECDIDVVESSPGLLMTPGRVVVGRAGVHLKFKRTHLGVEAVHDLSPADTPHRPAVDVLFESAAAAYGSGVLGVVLTGMGDDGLRGSRAIKDRGGELITESEASCVVYGMPRCVDEAGLSSASVAVDGMVAEILIRL